jgi:hypothetical protein
MATILNDASVLAVLGHRANGRATIWNAQAVRACAERCVRLAQRSP